MAAAQGSEVPNVHLDDLIEAEEWSTVEAVQRVAVEEAESTGVELDTINEVLVGEGEGQVRVQLGDRRDRRVMPGGDQLVESLAEDQPYRYQNGDVVRWRVVHQPRNEADMVRQEFVHRYMERLPEHWQRVLEMAFWERAVQERAAAQEGVSQQALSLRLQTALRAITREMALDSPGFLAAELLKPRAQGRPARDYDAERDAAYETFEDYVRFRVNEEWAEVLL